MGNFSMKNLSRTENFLATVEDSKEDGEIYVISIRNHESNEHLKFKLHKVSSFLKKIEGR